MPKTLKRIAPDPDVIRLQALLSANGYFKDRIPQNGIFEAITFETVQLFQLQHVDETGLPLKADGEVGPKTWWALSNPSGDAQKNNFKAILPKGLTATRTRLIELILEEHDKPVFEVPDGSNRSEDIDTYWGNTGLKGYAWCCAFVSWALHQALGYYPIQGRHHVGVQNMWRAAGPMGMATTAPKPGDLFIQIKSGGKGHTGFVIGIPPSEDAVYTCEGNCGNRLKVGLRPLETIDHFIDCIKDGQSPNFSKQILDIGSVNSQTTR